MKKIIISLILCISVLFCVSVYAESENITVFVNGSVLETPIPAQLVNDRTMLPMRSVFESLGAKVTWFGEDRIIFAVKGDTFITLKIGVSEMSVQKIGSDENVSVSLDTAPYIDRDYTLVPVRAAAEALQAEVLWEAENRTVHISAK